MVENWSDDEEEDVDDHENEDEVEDLWEQL